MIILLTKNLLARNSLALAIIASAVLMGAFSSLSYRQFLYLQSQNISQLSVFNEVIQPLSGLALLLQLVTLCIASSLLVPHMAAQGQKSILVNASISAGRRLLMFALPTLLASLLPLFYFMVIAVSYWLASDLDGWLLVSSSIGLVAASCFFCVVAVTISFLLRTPLMALLASIFTSALILLFDEWLRNLVAETSPFLEFFYHLRGGLISPFEVLKLALWLMLFIGLAFTAVSRYSNANDGAGKRYMMFAVCGITLLSIFVAIQRSDFFDASNSVTSRNSLNFRWDISQEKRDSLQQQWIEQIEQVNQPIKITAVIDDEENHDEIKRAVDILSQHHADIELSFSSRQKLSVNSEFAGEFVAISVGKQQQNIAYPFNQTAKHVLTKLIVQLTTRSGHWINFIEGHGEASPFGKTSRDLSSFYDTLKSLGWPVAVQNLSRQPVISSNTKLLVIAASEKRWLSSEVDSVMQYLHKGGNLLVLREQGDQLPAAIEDFTQVAKVKGTLIDWQGYQSGTPHPAILIIDQVLEHPVNTGIKSFLAFPWSTGLRLKLAQPDYSQQPILVTHKGVWNEYNSQAETLSFDAQQGELQQSFVSAFAISHRTNNQKMVVVGDASFISDAAVNNYSNRQFSLNLISYLSSESITEENQVYQDNAIRVNTFGHWLFSWFFAFLIPGILALIYFGIKLRFRKLI